MKISEFFNELRERKWALYVPKRIYLAHHDGLLRGWGIDGTARMTRLLELLKEQGVNLRVPFLKQYRPTGWILENFSDWIVPHEDENDCPSFPEPVISSDAFWDAFSGFFRLTGSVTNRILGVDGWAHSVRFFTLWTTANKKFTDEDPRWIPDHPSGRLIRRADLPFDQLLTIVKEWNSRKHKATDTNRILRTDYSITSNYCDARRATLVVLKKVYPPEQVRHVRRQLEEKLRKDPAEAIRYGLERGLLK